MAQESYQQRENVNNLDKVEPYGSNAAARAASQTSDMFARVGASVAGMLGKFSKWNAERQAQQATFDIDPETGVPVLPKSFAIGSPDAMMAYQNTIDTRYEDALFTSLEGKLQGLENQFVMDEEGYRQAAAIEVGAMASKVNPNFLDRFTQRAAKVNAQIGSQIGYRVAQENYRESRMAARASGSRSSSGVGRSKKVEEADKEVDTKFDAAVRLEEIKDQMIEDGAVEKYDAAGLEPRKEIDRAAETQLRREIQNIKTEAPDEASEDTKAEAKANKEELINTEFNFQENLKTGKEAATDWNRLVVQDPGDAAVDFSSLSGSEQERITEAVLPGSKIPSFWMDPTNFNMQNLGPGQRKLLSMLPFTEDVPAGLEATWEGAIDGSVQGENLLVPLQSFQQFGGSAVDQGSWAAQNPEEAANLDLIYRELQVGTRREDATLDEAITEAQQRVLANSVSDADIAARLDLGENSGRPEIETEVTRYVHGYVQAMRISDPDIGDYLSQAMYHRLRMGDNRSLHSIFKDEYKKSITKVDGASMPDGTPARHIMSRNYPAIQLSDTDNPMDVTRRVAAEFYYRTTGERIDWDDDGLRIIPKNGGHEFQIVVDDEPTQLTFDSNTVQQIVYATDERRSKPIGAWRDLDEEVNALLREVNDMNYAPRYTDPEWHEEMDYKIDRINQLRGERDNLGEMMESTTLLMDSYPEVYDAVYGESGFGPR